MTNQILAQSPSKKQPPNCYRASRRYKLWRIGQAHLAAGMSLERWRAILDAHDVGDSWEAVTDETIDAIIEEIAEIVRQAGGGR